MTAYGFRVPGLWPSVHVRCLRLSGLGRIGSWGKAPKLLKTAVQFMDPGGGGLTWLQALPATGASGLRAIVSGFGVEGLGFRV